MPETGARGLQLHVGERGVDAGERVPRWTGHLQAEPAGDQAVRASDESDQLVAGARLQGELVHVGGIGEGLPSQRVVNSQPDRKVFRLGVDRDGQELNAGREEDARGPKLHQENLSGTGLQPAGPVEHQVTGSRIGRDEVQRQELVGDGVHDGEGDALVGLDEQGDLRRGARANGVAHDGVRRSQLAEHGVADGEWGCRWRTVARGWLGGIAAAGEQREE